MLAGHFGLAAAVKARQGQLPLWSLMLATQMLDVIFLGTYAAGVESLRTAEGATGGYGSAYISADYTHSLVGSLGISLVVLVVGWIFWGRGNGLVLGAVTFSHWLLDLIVHRADMPILPGNAGDLPRFGLGLWQIPWAAAAVELGIILAGAYLYYHASVRRGIMADRKAKAETGKAPGFRQNATVSSIVVAVLLVVTLVGDFFLG